MQQMVQDGQYLAVFNSTHRVLKAEGLLKAAGLPILLIPAPRTVQADCGLAIRFNPEEQNAVLALLTREDLLPAFLCRLEQETYLTVEEYSHADH